MKQRILVAVFGIPLILAVVVFAPDWATAVALAVLCVIGAHELLNAVCGADKAKRWFGLAGAMAVFTLLDIYCADVRFAGTVLPTLAVFFRAAMVVLRDGGWYTLPLAAGDKIFGPEMEAAVRRLQAAKGLTADGIVGPDTWPRLLGV